MEVSNTIEIHLGTSASAKSQLHVAKDRGVVDVKSPAFTNLIRSGAGGCAWH